jgi:hypothetical protein
VEPSSVGARAYSARVATDPTPYLSTMTGASASLVAIVGGLLVARYVGLDSVQQGADQVLNDAMDRLKTARDRAGTAANKLLRFEASDFLGDSQVLNDIHAGITDLATLRVTGGYTPMSDEELQPFVDALVKEFATARSTLDATIPLFHEIPEPDKRTYTEWRLFYPALASKLPPDLDDQVWKRAFEDVCGARLEAHAEWKKAHPNPPKNELQRLAELHQSIIGSTTPFLSPLATKTPADYTAINARRRDDLRSERDRTHQHLEDLEGEVRRLEQARAAIVKPDKLLWQGFLILFVFSGVGVIAPLWAMSRTPRDLTPHLSWLFYGFAVMLTILIGYFAGHAWRLTRGRKRTARRQADPNDPQGHA